MVTLGGLIKYQEPDTFYEDFYGKYIHNQTHNILQEVLPINFSEDNTITQDNQIIHMIPISGINITKNLNAIVAQDPELKNTLDKLNNDIATLGSKTEDEKNTIYTKAEELRKKFG